MRTALLVILMVASQQFAIGQEVLPLDSCRARALRNNKELKMAASSIDAAHWNRKAAFTKYLPHVDASASYMFTSREISLLTDEQKDALRNVGNTVGQIVNQMGQLGTTISQTMMGAMQVLLPTMTPQQQIAMQQLLNSQQMMALKQGFTNMQSQAAQLPGMVQGLADNILQSFDTDTRNAGMVSILFQQPIYMGGKIVAYNKIARTSEMLAKSKMDLASQNVLVAVDETYWNIVQLSSKKRLAESYLKLIERLDGDVEQLIKEGFATRADGLSVKVKLNEAKVSVLQVDNGLTLLKMLLAQQCGMEHTDFTLADEGRDGIHYVVANLQGHDNETEALANRPEIAQLQYANEIYKQKVRLARAEFLPQIAAMGGYMWTSPSVFNGFENTMRGMWTVGVGAKIPLVTWGECTYKVRAAKAEANVQRLKMEEVSEKISLQVKQCEQKLQEAQERLHIAESNRNEADENLRMAEFGLKEGVIPLSNVLTAQTAWLSAHSTYLTAEIDVVLADVYLRKALGGVRF